MLVYLICFRVIVCVPVFVFALAFGVHVVSRPAYCSFSRSPRRFDVDIDVAFEFVLVAAFVFVFVHGNFVENLQRIQALQLSAASRSAPARVPLKQRLYNEGNNNIGICRRATTSSFCNGLS